MKQKIENKAQLKDQEFVGLLREMWRIRLFEEEVEKLYFEGEIYGTIHLCIGQEATAVGSSYLLKRDDWIMSTHRNHGHSLAKGSDMRAMMAEILGRKTGINQGKGGSMHITDVSVGNLGSNGIVGGNYPLATGAALTAQMMGTNQVVIAYNGDGSVNEGSFHEALNLASIWQLPVIFFIENNQYGMSSSIAEMMNVSRVSERGSSYGIPGVTIDGNDVVAVIDATQEAIKRCRLGQGPSLIEALTYRHRGHSKSDKRLYRTSAEERAWQQRDPILRLTEQVLTAQLLTESELDQLVASLKSELAAIVASVKKDPRPSAEALLKDVYAGGEL
ncbi:thiamine pyrophosphate-dependent dehydrogenase E1 component subunit alpha [Vagococcus sp. BWB3-3]|uniref:Thiamine pyrophosphate-dependent dehydrogenase E1 component subunit alpha n=1 Tax=Vagococcus allomyrinae TaxID=2794353 RepID=A0A940PHN7_9ENTE|nr:thiamine pyrophosphate-dependent dehydrogenase E1 component subunit alpha [Vagococcus allomyrinae]MBP1043118.1 thiamine pyrophosphate-dependent dehydrogenase E1 component subunit alpha [Vagococcus allomyrinae]